MQTEREKIMADARREVAKNKRKIIVRRVSIWGGSLLLLVAMVWGLAILASSRPENLATPGTLSEAINPTLDHLEGNPNAKVVLVEYSDFQCPACALYAPAVKNLMSKYGQKVQLIYRSFPLPQHDKGDLAARVAESAGVQGKFWEMHDKLFGGQALWAGKTESEAIQIFMSYADQIGLDKTKFSTDLNSAEIIALVQRSIQGGINSNVDATPTFFLNGKKLTNLSSYGDLETDVAAAIDRNK